MLKSEARKCIDRPEILTWLSLCGRFSATGGFGRHPDWTYAVPIATWPLPGQAAPESSTPIPAKLCRDITLQAIREIADEMERRPNDQDVVAHGIAAIQALTKFCDNTRS